MEKDIRVVCGYEWCSVDRFGTLYSSRRKNKAYKLWVDSDGYKHVTTKVAGKNVRISAHRAVAISFLQKPSSDRVFVNHKDGNKSNNFVDNLEWCTAKENSNHAWSTGLIKPKFGVDTSNNKYEEVIIRRICSLIESGYRNKEIISLIPDIDRKLPSDIRAGASWKHISKDYNIFVIRRGRLPSDAVHYVCKCLSEGKTPKEIVGGADNKLVTRSVVKHIKNRVVYKDIVKNYLF